LARTLYWCQEGSRERMASRLAKQLRHIRVRARRRGLPADVYVLSWQKTLEDFQGRCAYCDEHSGFTVDHFTALASGGGSTIDFSRVGFSQHNLTPPVSRIHCL